MQYNVFYVVPALLGQQDDVRPCSDLPVEYAGINPFGCHFATPVFCSNLRRSTILIDSGLFFHRLRVSVWYPVRLDISARFFISNTARTRLFVSSSGFNLSPPCIRFVDLIGIKNALNRNTKKFGNGTLYLIPWDAFAILI